jgi:RNA polymerase sigma-70 factor (ECF subfamily)
MGALMAANSDVSDRLMDSARHGDCEALNAVFKECRDRLRRMVQFRLDRRLQGRIDASDVLQEAFLEAARRIDNHDVHADMPLFLWLRLVVGEKLLELHRHHLGAAKRDPGRELSLYSGPLPAASSAALAANLVGRMTSPSQAAERAERVLKVQEALNSMDDIDREVLALRHFEQLSNAEAARTLGIDESAASNRYVRALKRLRKILNDTDV